MGKVTSIQFFGDDKVTIESLVRILRTDMGDFVSQRVAVMVAVNKLLKEYNENNKG